MKEKKATNVTWHEHKVSRKDREKLLDQRGVVLWFTGLSGSGKSTIANRLKKSLAGVVPLLNIKIVQADNIGHILLSKIKINSFTWSSRRKRRIFFNNKRFRLYPFFSKLEKWV